MIKEQNQQKLSEADTVAKTDIIYWIAQWRIETHSNIQAHTHTHTRTDCHPCFLSHHNSEDVLCPGFIVEPVCGVDDSCARIDPKQPHTGRVYAAIDGEAQTGTLINVRCSDPQQLHVNWYVLRYADIISW